MNFNVLAYSLYLSITIFIIVYVGSYFYRNGRIFILTLLKGNEEFTDQINKLLLVAYYLFNIGYALLQLQRWQRITGFEPLLSSLSQNIGLLVLILAITHYFNMTIIYYLSKSNSLIHKFQHHE